MCIVLNSILCIHILVPNSSWVALRAECIIPNVSKYAIFDVLSDDSRMGEYDDMYDGMEVSVCTGTVFLDAFCIIAYIFAHRTLW